MPSKNTSVISARVKDETVLKFTQIAENRGITVAKLLDEISEQLDENTLLEKGVTPDGYAVFDDSDIDSLDRLRELKFEKLLQTFDRKKYSDEAIRRAVEGIIQTVLDNPNFSPRRARYDEGC